MSRIPALVARVSVIVLCAVAVVASAAPTMGHDGRASAEIPGDPQLRGLRPAATGRCAGGYRIEGTDLCTHGPDARPTTRPRLRASATLAAQVLGPLPDAVLCDGDGRSGKRVQAIYARTAATPSRRSEVVPRIRAAAATVQAAFLASAARTDGVRRPRWVTDGGCRVQVEEVVLSESARRTLGATITELQALGHERPDRKYLIWFDTSVYCGIATFFGDDRPGADNLSDTRPGYGRVDAGCWGWAEAHELMHTLGAVQSSAPNTTAGTAPGAFGHCTDEYDAMCYADAAGVTLRVVCPDRGLDGQFDCGNDDYFHTDPPAGSYLGERWNTADSSWLARTVVQLVQPDLTLDPGRTVRSTRVPVSVLVASRAPLAGVESVQVQRRRGSARWRSMADADATTLRGRIPTGTDMRFRARAQDASGASGPWRLGAAATARVRDDGHPSLRWSGGWRKAAVSGSLGGRVARARQAGRSLRVTTDARQLGIVATRAADAGRLEIRVDGARVRVVDLANGPPSTRTMVAVIDLPAGRHTVTVRALAPASPAGPWRVDLDAIVLLTR